MPSLLFFQLSNLSLFKSYPESKLIFIKQGDTLTYLLFLTQFLHSTTSLTLPNLPTLTLFSLHHPYLIFSIPPFILSSTLSHFNSNFKPLITKRCPAALLPNSPTPYSFQTTLHLPVSIPSKPLKERYAGYAERVNMIIATEMNVKTQKGS